MSDIYELNYDPFLDDEWLGVDLFDQSLDFSQSVLIEHY